MLAVNLGSTVVNLKSKIKEYLTRAELLKKTIGKVIYDRILKTKILTCITFAISHTEQQKKQHLESKPKTDEDGQTLKRAQFLLNEALEEDENGNVETAIQLYMESIDLCIKLVC